MTQNGKALINMQALTKVFTTDEVETHALSGIHLEIGRGEFVSISGPSGCGKSTLLSILGLLDTATDGQYWLDGKPVQSLSFLDRARIRNREIGFIFQSFNLIGDLTVYENVELPLTYRGMKAAERKTRVNEALEKVGMAHRARHLPSQLSGGQQQRVAIARALAMRPQVMLFDEVTAALDPETRKEVLATIRQLIDEGMTSILVTHEMAFAREIAQHVYFTDQGLIVEHGPPARLFGNPQKQRTRAFLEQILQ
jgi:putative ABC transport system ATP-binding protein